MITKNIPLEGKILKNNIQELEIFLNRNGIIEHEKNIFLITISNSNFSENCLFQILKNDPNYPGYKQVKIFWKENLPEDISLGTDIFKEYNALFNPMKFNESDRSLDIISKTNNKTMKTVNINVNPKPRNISKDGPLFWDKR